ncbi:MAG: DUF1553 domain-containing protein [Alistipes sp.]|nr:DUF1553 domain-containing protein [Candidatus Alistipes equi]
MNLKSGIIILLLFAALAAKAQDIDQCVNSKLALEGITPSGKCSDATFLRRTYLVLTSAVPSVEETKAFLESTDANKRAKLVSKLLDSKGWIDNMVLRWGDMLRIKSEFPSCIWPNGVQAFNRWLMVQFRDNVPYDAFVKELLCSTGSNFRTAPVNLFRINTKRTPKTFCDDIALIFMGQRSHPKEWEKFFTQVYLKGTKEWKEEILCLDLDKPAPKNVYLGGKETISCKKRTDYRIDFANWLTSKDNRQFAAVFVNRVWSWLMGTGIVEPVDDFSNENLPSNPELLDCLTTLFISNGYNVKELFRSILLSETYSRTCRTNSSNRSDQRLFSHYIPHRLTGEQISDAISSITGNFDIFASRAPEPFTKYPKGTRSIEIGDGTVTISELEVLGRPSRDVSSASARARSYNYKQVIYLLNSDHILQKVRKNRALTPIIYNEKTTKEEIVDYLYLSYLNRHATDNEKKTIVSLLPNAHVTTICEDVSIALLNSDEFLFVH